MVRKVISAGVLIYQTADDYGEAAEAALLLHEDGGGTLVLDQEGREIILNRATLPELRKALRAREKR